jgi:hypothetical protein
MLGDKPNLEFVASEHVAHEEIVRPVVTVLSDSDLVGLEEAGEHGRHLFGPVGRPGNSRDFGTVARIGNYDALPRP